MDLKQEVEQLKKEVEQLKGQLNARNNRISRFVDAKQKGEFGALMAQQVMDVVWNDYYYVFEILGSLDAHDYGGSTNNPTHAGLLVTDAVSNDYVYDAYGTGINKTFNYDKETRFRVAVRWEETGGTSGAVQNQLSYITTLDDATTIEGGGGEDVSAVGFKAVDGTLYGVVKNGSETTVELGSIVYNTYYKLELVYYPNNRVDFYVDDKFVASITSALPVSADNGLAIYNTYIKTTEAVAKTMVIDYFELMQKRS